MNEKFIGANGTNEGIEVIEIRKTVGFLLFPAKQGPPNINFAVNMILGFKEKPTKPTCLRQKEYFDFFVVLEILSQC